MVGHATDVNAQTLPTRRRSIASRACGAQMPPTRPADSHVAGEFTVAVAYALSIRFGFAGQNPATAPGSRTWAGAPQCTTL